VTHSQQRLAVILWKAVTRIWKGRSKNMSGIVSSNAAALVDKDETSRTSAPTAAEESSGLPLMQVGSEGIVGYTYGGTHECPVYGTRKVSRPAISERTFGNIFCEYKLRDWGAGGGGTSVSSVDVVQGLSSAD
jgi:hypothetical protein